MSALNGLKLVVSKKQSAASPIVQRRSKLVAKLEEQINLCEAKRDGKTFAPTRLKTVVNEQTGERTKVEAVKKVKEWFWINDAGKINLAVKYGAKTLSLNSKGANAIELKNGDELIATLTALKTATLNGELDDAINEASAATRKSFAK